MPRLQVFPPQGDPFVRSLEQDALIIGRSATADVVLDDRFLSREHARLFRDGERLMVEDLGSYNGTFLNDTRLTAPAELRPGDVIRLSGVSIRLLGEEGEDGAVGSDGPDAESTFRSADEILRADSGTAEAPPAEERESLRRYAERMRILNEVHRALVRPIGLEELLELILDRVFDHLEPEDGAVFLLDDDGEPYRAASRSAPGHDQLYSSSLIEAVIDEGMGALVNDVRTDSRFATSESIVLSGVRSIVAAPLLAPDGVKGMIALSSRVQVRQFAQEDMELLVSLASVAALHIRNVALAEEAVERRRLEEEIALARQIQVSLLPSRLPEIEGYELHGGTLPSQTVSGDYYVVVERGAGRESVIMVADVSGKGIAASLLTASLEALASGLIEVDQPPEQICTLASGQLHARTSAAKYASAFVAALDFGTGTLRYANAGHNPGLLVRSSGKVENLASTGPPLGLVPGASFEGAEVVLQPGDLLVLYTDGITEAADPGEREFGTDRLAELCAAHRTLPLDEIAGRVERALESFVRGVPFADDRTLVLVRRTPNG